MNAKQLRYLRSLSDSQLTRFYVRCYDRAADAFAGGLDYGMDWPTLRACLPGIYRPMRAAHDEMRNRARARRFAAIG